MYNERFSRTIRLIGEEAAESLTMSRIAVFGLGGVGGYSAEALARAGVGAVDLVDFDIVSRSNINRQIIADETTVGQYKTEVMAQRIKKINPDCKVTEHRMFFSDESIKQLDLKQFDYIIDAIDTVSSKLLLIMQADRENIPMISCMGTGNKLDPLKLTVTDIYKTSMCPLAAVIRRELRHRGVRKLKVVYSTEQPVKVKNESENGRNIPASISYVPPVAGMIAAGEAIRFISGIAQNK